MAATNYAINKTLNRQFRKTYYNITTNYYYVGLSTTAIDEYGNGVTEPSHISYERVPININQSDSIFSSPEDGKATNRNSAVEFNVAREHWGRIREVFLALDQKSSGSSILFHSRIDPPFPVLEGTKIKFDIDSLILNRKE